MENLGFIYLIFLREFINANQDIFKIGCCENIDRRKAQYPKKSIVIFHRYTSNYKEIEKKIIQIFDSKYICRRDIGREYYEGNHNDMINDICQIINDINTFRINQNQEIISDLCDKFIIHSLKKSDWKKITRDRVIFVCKCYIDGFHPEYLSEFNICSLIKAVEKYYCPIYEDKNVYYNANLVNCDFMNCYEDDYDKKTKLSEISSFFDISMK